MKARKRPRRETAAYFKLIKDYSAALRAEFMRQYRATLKYMAENDIYRKAYELARKEHPELYEKPKEKGWLQRGLELYNIRDGIIPDYSKRERSPELIEKSKASDINKINKWFEGWDKNVKPENMAKVIKHYAKEAAILGGNQALKDLGIKIAFNMKDPAMIRAFQSRGENIAEPVADNTRQNLVDAMYKVYMEEGATPYELKKELEDKLSNLFEDSYANRAMTIARTETGIAQMETTMTTYERNGVKKKKWLAVLDARTRHSHELLDAQDAIPIDQPFHTEENGDIMYPMDPNADPAEVINCRCDLLAVDISEDICTGDESKDPAGCKMPWTGGEEEGEE